jgi:hypothetical protein
MVVSADVLATALSSDQRRVSIFSEGYRAPALLSEFPTHHVIQSELTRLREFIIRVGLQSATLESLRYETQDNELQLFLLPKRGYFEPKDVQLSSGSFAYDCIITIGVDRRSAIGVIEQEQAEFFSHTPIITIDHRAQHDHFGQINLLDPTATSVSENIVPLLHQLQYHLNEDEATQLFAGMMSQSKAFQAATVTPKSLATAATLLTAGARRDHVVRVLYQTKSLATLRLWGAALSNLSQDTSTGIAYTSITKKDLARTHASFEDAVQLLDELLSASPDPVVVLCIETDRGTEVRFVVREGGQPPASSVAFDVIDIHQSRVHLDLPITQAISTVLGWWKTPVRG